MAPEDHDPARESVERDRERTEGVQAILDEFESSLAEPKYPVRREEVSQWYATQVEDVPNETETLGDAVDRLSHGQYGSRAELEEDLFNELTGEEMGPQEYNDERDLEEIAEAVAGSGTPPE